MALLLGTLDADVIRGTAGADQILGLNGDDWILGGAGLDIIEGGFGRDIIYAGGQAAWDDGVLDTVLAGADDDHVYGGYGDILNGGTGFDTLSLDLSSATTGQRADFRPTTLLDLGDLLTLSNGLTERSGFQAVADVRGTNFDDRIIVVNADDIATNLQGGAGDDYLRAGTGNDELIGGTGNDRVFGRSGNDHLTGGDGNDRLTGGSGNDTLVGGEGSDKLMSGRGKDTLTGGDGADRFIFDAVSAGQGVKRADVITDFSRAEGDRIGLSGMDAIAGGDDDAFSFIGSSAFSGAAGELRVVVRGGETLVMGDTDGNGRADFSIRLEGEVPLGERDFIL